MQLNAGMGKQPSVHHGRFVRREVVDHVDGQPWLGLAVDLVQKVPEVHCPVLGGQVADHLPGRGVQRGEQVDGAVPDVIVAAPLGGAGHHGQHRRGPLQGLDLRLLVNPKTAAFAGGARYKPATSWILSIAADPGRS